MLSLRIKLSTTNHLYGHKSSQMVILWDSYLTFDLTKLLTVEESLLCDYSMVVEYILKMNLMKHKKI